jgi:hypothetical protein
MRQRKPLAKFRILQAELDQLGYIVDIRTVSEDSYSFAVNGEIKKVYKKREGANKALIKLHKKLKNQTLK